MNISVRLAAIVSLLILLVLPSNAADTLPAQLSDEAYWQLVTGLSEPGGKFPYENFVSNERSFQSVFPGLKQNAPSGGAYIGVGPEQNFTYIAALQPKIAFVLDIRRQNMIELLMYKALFEMSSNRADFISHLFARPRPEGLNAQSTADELFLAFGGVKFDAGIFDRDLKAIQSRLTATHKFSLTNEDVESIDYVYRALSEGGPGIDYKFKSPSAPAINSSTTYAELMTAADPQGRNWSYLASEENYRVVREMQLRNLIIPLVGDFVGPKTLVAVGEYLKQHGVTVSAFYTSNVEEYIRAPLGNYRQFCSSVASLPVDPASKFITWTAGTAPKSFVRSMPDFIQAFNEGKALPYEVRDANGRLMVQISCH